MRTARTTIWAFCCVVALACASNRTAPTVLTGQTGEARSPREILASYAEAWRGKDEFPLPKQVVLSFHIGGAGGGDFNVALSGARSAELREGRPEHFDYGLRMDVGMLRRLDAGDINILTALGQAVASDPTPVELALPEGFKWTVETRGFLAQLLFHFWTRDWPPVVRFGERHARSVHGGNATVFFYDGVVRTAWYQVKPGMHINADPVNQVDDLNNLFIVTRGRLQARLGGRERVLEEGDVVLIPAGMSHEFWVDEKGYGEFVLLMFPPRPPGQDASPQPATQR